MIKGCAKLKVLKEDKSMGWFGKVGFGFDKFVQSSLVNVYSKCGEIGSVQNVFDEIDEKDLVLCNSLLNGYAGCGEVKPAMRVFEEMPEKDCFCWTVWIDGLAKCGEVELARDIFKEMPKRPRGAEPVIPARKAIS